jgi:hypothetical protein
LAGVHAVLPEGFQVSDRQLFRPGSRMVIAMDVTCIRAPTGHGELATKRRLPGTTRVAPSRIAAEPSSMPPQNCVRLHDASHTKQAWPKPSHQYQQHPVATTQARMLRSTPQGNIELMPKKEILDFKPTPRLEQVGGKCPKQMEDCKHRTGSCADSASCAYPPGQNFRERQPVHRSRALPSVPPIDAVGPGSEPESALHERWH